MSMDAPKSKSKKRSATKVKQLNLNEVTFFIDRSIESKTLVRRLIEAGCRLELHSKNCEHNLADEIWLRKASENNWVTIAKDKQIAKTPFERDSLLASRGKAFLLSAGDLKSNEIANVMVASLDEILKILARYPDTTFIAKITKQGKVKIWKTERHMFSD